jgi:hypothetical protein
MRRWNAYWSGWHCSAALNILLVSSISGCGDSSATVTGHVRYKGEAVAVGNVTFYGSDNQLSTALINADGSYTATKVPLGPVKVAVTTPPKNPAALANRAQKRKQGQVKPPAAKRVFVPSKYSRPDKSGLELTVTSGTQTFDIDLN